MGSPETEETQNRLVAYTNRAVVVSVDYRKWVVPVGTNRSVTNFTERQNIRTLIHTMIVTMRFYG